MTLSALVNRLRKVSPTATDTEIRDEVVEKIRHGIAEGDPAYVDLLQNLVVESLFSDGE